MSGAESSREEQVILEPDGRMILPARVMEEIVVATPGCRLWFNEKTRALGLRLLRGEDEPPYCIQRRVGPEGQTQGLLEAGPFLRRVGFTPEDRPRACSYRYFERYHLLEVQLAPAPPREGLKTEGFLEDYPGLGE